MNSNGSSTPDVPDKEQLYGEFQSVEDWNKSRLKWQDALHKKTAYKALDIGDPDEVGDINVTGVDAKGLATILSSMAPKPKSSSPLKWLALAAGVGIPAIMAPAIIEAFKTDPAPVVIEQGSPIEGTDTNTQYELQFFED